MLRIRRLQAVSGWCRPGCVALLGAFLLGCEADVPTQAVEEALSAETVAAEAAAAVSDAPEPEIQVEAPQVERRRNQPLWILDDVPLSPEETVGDEWFMAFDLKRVEIIKRPEAISRFGERAKYGAVLMFTKD